MSVTLSGYITEVRRLLHDATGNFYTDAELIDYINSARNRVVRDSGCLRSLQSVNTVTSQETYSFSAFPQGTQTMDVLNINLIWGNTRIPMRYLPWTQFNAELRFWQNYVGRPIAFSMYGPQTVYISPVPDQVYAMEIDTVIMPTDLVNGGDVDTIPVPWNTPVSFYAAYKAKYKEQSYGEADLFKKEYVAQMQSVLTSTFTRRIPNPYNTIY